LNTTNDQKEKEQHMSDYIKQLAAIENAIEPFKEQKKDLRESFHENGWLTKEEMRLAVKAYRLVKSDTDMDELVDCFQRLKKARVTI
tara:strand:+ start:12121 stop:12381 length:261 start_codon:yes stop_codon:yes gene_type:complete